MKYSWGECELLVALYDMWVLPCPVNIAGKLYDKQGRQGLYSKTGNHRDSGGHAS